jgi:branched-chain amino acid transport system substrate-binding protein
MSIVLMMVAGAPALAEDVIKIGYTAPFTGSGAEYGTNGWRGMQLALEELNAKGVKVGDKTYKIEIVRYDSVCTPTEGVANVRKLALEDKVVGILGDHCSSVCTAIAPLCDEYKIPGLTIECAADKVTKPGSEYYFRMRPSMGLDRSAGGSSDHEDIQAQNRGVHCDQRRLRQVVRRLF